MSFIIYFSAVSSFLEMMMKMMEEGSCWDPGVITQLVIAANVGGDTGTQYVVQGYSWDLQIETLDILTCQYEWKFYKVYF